MLGVSLFLIVLGVIVMAVTHILQGRRYTAFELTVTVAALAFVASAFFYRSSDAVLAVAVCGWIVVFSVVSRRWREQKRR